MEPALYVNRELSWLEFDQRVLEEALDPSVPLARAGEVPGHRELEPRRVLHGARRRIEAAHRRRLRHFRSRRPQSGRDARPPSRRARTSSPSSSIDAGSTSSSRRSRARASRWSARRSPPPSSALTSSTFVRETLLPVLTPLAIDPGHPFPYLANRTLCLVAQIRARRLRRSFRGRASSSSTCRARCCRASCPCRAARARRAFMRLEDVARLVLAVALSRLRGRLVPRHPRDARRRDRPAERRGRRHARGRRIEPPRAAHGRRRAPRSTTRTCPSDVLETLVDHLELEADATSIPARGSPRSRISFQLYGASTCPASRSTRRRRFPCPRSTRRRRRVERHPRGRHPRPPPLPVVRRR